MSHLILTYVTVKLQGNVSRDSPVNPEGCLGPTVLSFSPASPTFGIQGRFPQATEPSLAPRQAPMTRPQSLPRRAHCLWQWARILSPFPYVLYNIYISISLYWWVEYKYNSFKIKIIRFVVPAPLGKAGPANWIRAPGIFPRVSQTRQLPTRDIHCLPRCQPHCAHCLWQWAHLFSLIPLSPS